VCDQAGVVGGGEGAGREGSIGAGNAELLPSLVEVHTGDVGSGSESADDLTEGEDLVTPAVHGAVHDDYGCTVVEVDVDGDAAQCAGEAAVALGTS
jgi:hypothetical protein